MKSHLILTALFSVVLFSFCKGEKTGLLPEWGVKADSSSKAFIRNYWNREEKYFNYGNEGSKTEFHYWPQAHALDLMVDVYSRTGDTTFLTLISEWFEGVPRKNGGSFFNRYYDDMEWNALALLRAYQVTGDEKFIRAAVDLWEDIKTGWNDNAGGGIMWEKEDRYGKNSCSNGPAAILAARLYRLHHHPEDLEWAKKIFSWQRNTLFDTTTGAVWDNIKEKEGSVTINKKWIFTYNQGTFIGAATELFDLTGDSIYLYDANKAAGYTLRSLVTPDGLLKDEGSRDGGLFKGIFVRYLARLTQHHALPLASKKRYSQFLTHNANTLWNEGTNKKSLLYGPYWKTKPGETSDLTVALSGAMLMEAVADLEKKGYVMALTENTWPEWSGNPVFKGWQKIKRVDPVYGETEGFSFPARNIHFKWDSPDMRVTNFDEANQFVKREYRKGWGGLKL